MSYYVLSIDQGTSSSRALIYSVESTSVENTAAKNTFSLVAQASQTFKQHFPQPSWVEHDAEDIWLTVMKSCQEALKMALQSSSFDLTKLACVAITNQRETLCLWDAETGKPIMRAIVWQCKRSAAICQHWKHLGYETEVHQKTGLCIDPYFSATKLSWLLENHPHLRADLLSGKTKVGTVDSYLLYRLTSGTSYATEPSNACRTLLYGLRDSWDPDLCEMLDLPRTDVYPAVKDSCAIFGHTTLGGILPAPVPISGIVGDQQAATIGQQCLAKGQMKCTYGTGAFLMVHAGQTPIFSQSGLLTTVGWQVGGKKTYLIEGSSFMAGAAVDYLKDQWGLMTSAQDASHIKATASPRVMFVPELAGLGAPHWNPEVRGALLGLSRDTSKDAVIRAMLEGVIFRVTDLVETATADLGSSNTDFKVDGGMSQNDLAMQFQADMLSVAVHRKQDKEATALGAAIMAAYGAGLIDSLSLANDHASGQTFYPAMDQATKKIHRDAWKRALAAATLFADQSSNIANSP